MTTRKPSTASPPLQFPDVVAAARNASENTKALAEAIARAIPVGRTSGRKPSGDVTPSVTALMETMAEELAEHGYDYTVPTLKGYRQCAGWVQNRRGDFEWQPVGYGIHHEAYTNGMRFTTFRQHVASGAIKNRNDVRRLMGKQVYVKRVEGEGLDLVRQQVTDGKVALPDLIPLLTEDEGAVEELLDGLGQKTIEDALARQRRASMKASLDRGRKGRKAKEPEPEEEPESTVHMPIKRRTGRTPGKTVGLMEEGRTTVSAAYDAMFTSGLRDEDRNAVNKEIGTIYLLLDLMRVALNGGALNTSDLEFLSEHGVTVPAS